VASWSKKSGGHAVRNVAVEAFLGRVAFEQLAPAAAEARAPGVVEREFTRRQHADLFHAVERALRVDVEGLDRLDHVIVEIEPVGQGAARWEEIDQAAAEAEFAGRHHLGHVLVAGHRELLAEFLQRDALARFQEKGAAGEVSGRTKPHQRGRRRHHRDVEFAALDAIKRRQALRHQVVVRGKLVVGQGFPVRQQAYAQLRREPLDLFHQALRVECGGGDQRKRMALLLRQAREGQRIGGAGKPGVASTGGKRIAVHQKRAGYNYIVLN
jgi:hypothetical protein